MKKTALYIGIFTWSLVAIFFVAILVYGVSNGTIGGPAVLLEEKTVSTNGLENVVVESRSVKIEVLSTTDDQIKISQYGMAKTKSRDIFHLEEDGDGVRVGFDDSNRRRFFSFDFWSLDERLVIELPESYTNNIDFQSSSGGIRFKDDFTFQSVTLRSSSGGIRIEQSFSAANLSIDVSSGGVHADSSLTVDDLLLIDGSSGGVHLDGEVQANRLQAKVNSGGLDFGVITVNEFDLSSSSGSIRVEGISGGGNMETTSGSIKASLLGPLSQDVNLECSSGSIRLAVDSSLSFDFQGRTSSGSVKADFPLTYQDDDKEEATATVGDDPQATINAKCSSGSIRVSQQ